MIIAHLLIKLYEGESLTSTEEKLVKKICDIHNVTMEEAVALNIWSDNARPIQEYIKYGDTNRYCKEELNRLAEKLKGRMMHEPEIQYIVNTVRDIQYAHRILKDCYADVLPLCERNTKTSILATVRNLHIALNVTDIIAHIYKAMYNNPIEEPLTVYRAIEGQFIGRGMINQGFMSTSLTKEASFLKYTTYKTLFELTLPKGFHCINIIPFSNYDTEEKEVLLPPNAFALTERTAQNGYVYAKCTVYEIEEFR